MKILTSLIVCLALCACSKEEIERDNQGVCRYDTSELNAAQACIADKGCIHAISMYRYIEQLKANLRDRKCNVVQ